MQFNYAPQRLLKGQGVIINRIIMLNSNPTHKDS